MRVLVADDHDMLRDMLEDYFQRREGWSVSTARDLPSALDIMAQEPPFDLILLDFGMPGMQGLAGLQKALAMGQGRPVALFSGVVPAGMAAQAVELGAAGVLRKSLSAQELAKAMRAIAQGARFPVPATAPAAQPNNGLAGHPRIARLTPRDFQVLDLVCQGMSNRDIGALLGMPEDGAKQAVRSVCRKLGAANRTQAAMIGRDSGLC